MTGIRKATGFFGILAAMTVAISACSDTPTQNTDQASVAMQSEMTTSTVMSTASKGSSLNGGGTLCDSLKVTRARILISRMKLHREDQDGVTGDRDVKVGPFLVQFDASGGHVFANAVIPPGNYDKVKFEFHKLASSEVSVFLSDILFADFVTDERSTLIIDGTVYTNGVAFPFTYKSDVTENIEYKLDNHVVLAGGTSVTLALVCDPVIIFRSAVLGRVLDPRDGANEHDIDGSIKLGFKILKHAS